MQKCYEMAESLASGLNQATFSDFSQSLSGIFNALANSLLVGISYASQSKNNLIVLYFKNKGC